MPPHAQQHLTRADLCRVTDYDLERFKSLSRRRNERRQLPFHTVDGLTPDQEDRMERLGRRRYSWDDALLLMVMDDLTRNSGIPAHQAASIAGSCAYLIRDSWLLIIAGDPPFFVGYASQGAEENSGGGHIGGTLGHIELKLRAEKIKWPHEDEFSRLVLSNVTYAARRLRHNAAELGLEIPADFWSPDRFSTTA